LSRASIDWEEVRRRLRKSEDALQETLSENPARMRAVFHQRAIQLAKEHADNQQASKGMPVLIFRLAHEQYAIALRELAEVLPFQGCTPVPGSSPEFLGVINLRGELRPVIDLARVLSGSASTDSGAVLVLRRQAGLKVDSAEELREIRSDEMTPPARGHHVQALVNGTLALLDVETILSAVCSVKEP
jgi:purine-binding chemotaxis protein CheW